MFIVKRIVFNRHSDRFFLSLSDSFEVLANAINVIVVNVDLKAELSRNFAQRSEQQVEPHRLQED